MQIVLLQLCHVLYALAAVAWSLDPYIAYPPCLQIIGATSTPSNFPFVGFLNQSILSPVYALIFSFPFNPLVIALSHLVSIVI